jgi:hypothetical protein
MGDLVHLIASNVLVLRATRSGPPVTAAFHGCGSSAASDAAPPRLLLVPCERPERYGGHDRIQSRLT